MKINVELLEPFDWEDKQFVVDADIEKVGDLIKFLFDAEHSELEALLVKRGKINPTMMVLVNGVSVWDLGHKLSEGDELVFSRTVSGG